LTTILLLTGTMIYFLWMLVIGHELDASNLQTCLWLHVG
jgi:hypothetical protein